ncbi:MAG: protein kinase domain-containing protein [Aureliella sp.]
MSWHAPSSVTEELVVRLVAEDIRLLAKAGESPQVESYLRDFPELAHSASSWQVTEAFDRYAVPRLASAGDETWRTVFASANAQPWATSANGTASEKSMPEVDLTRLNQGDRILEFEVLRTLGEGTFGRVYLAKDGQLDRFVALKCTSDTGNEGKALARVNHPNIVRVHQEHVLGSKRVLVMEFVAGGSLQEWIATKASSAESLEPNAYSDWAERIGRSQRVKVSEDRQLREVPDEESVPVDARGPAVVSAWIVRQMADALQHAHGCGVLHLDIKPANILVNECGKPLLTDFNVSQLADDQSAYELGGTFNYMSPEQLKAFCIDVRNSETQLDVRSDIYSLGIVLMELLSGRKTWGQVQAGSADTAAKQLLAVRMKSGPPSLLPVCGVDAALNAIVQRALEPYPGDRYQTAAEMATDLSAWLADCPNRHAANPSLKQNTKRYLARNRRKLGWVVAAGMLAMTIAVLSIQGDVQRLRQVELKLDSALLACEQQQNAKAAADLGEARTRFGQLWAVKLVQPVRLAALAERIAVCEEKLREQETSRFSALFGQASLVALHRSGRTDGNDLIEDSLKAYRVMSAKDWQAESPFADLSETQKTQVAENISELMLVSILDSCRERSPSADQWSSVLSRLPREHRSYQVFNHLKATVYDVPDTELQHAGSERPFRNDYDAYLHGVWASHLGQHELASEWYSVAAAGRQIGKPERFWLRYRQGLSCQHLGRMEQAAIYYAMCIGIRPDFAWAHFNMGLVCFRTGQDGEAMRSLEHALRLDPKLEAAYNALGAIYLAADEPQAALAVFDRAISKGLSSDELLANRERAEQAASSHLQ